VLRIHEIWILLFSSVTFKTVNKKICCLLLFKGTFTHHYSKIKSHKEVNNGSGSGRPKNIWILLIRIRNTGTNSRKSRHFRRRSTLTNCVSNFKQNNTRTVIRSYLLYRTDLCKSAGPDSVVKVILALQYGVCVALRHLKYVTAIKGQSCGSTSLRIRIFTLLWIQI
jgi:hypothetical protein